MALKHKKSVLKHRKNGRPKPSPGLAWPEPGPGLARAQVGPEQTFKNHQNRLKRGRGGSVWAQTLSKRRPEAQDHFPSPPGPKNPIKKIKKTQRTARHPGRGAVQAIPTPLTATSLGCKHEGQPDTLDSKTHRTPLAHHRTPDTLAQGNERPLVAP